MATRSSSKKIRLEEYLRERQPAAIGEDTWAEIALLLAPVSESYLRDLVQAAGLPVAQPMGGARLGSFEELEKSLLELEKVYAQATAGADFARATACRRAVIQAKDRARLISRNEKVSADKRSEKAEMTEWMLVWLQNPGIFESWVTLRKKSITCRSESG